MNPGSIYEFLVNELIKGKPPLRAAFSDWLTEDIQQYEGFEKTEEADLVDVATDHLDTFDVYFTRHGYEGDPSFVICKKGLSIPEIWKELEIQDDTSLNEFYYHLFRLDEDGNASDTAIAKELNFPESMIFGSWKYSYNRKEKPGPYKNYYTTVRGNQIDKDQLDDFLRNCPNYPLKDHIDWAEIHNALMQQFGIDEEEAEDIMYCYFGITNSEDNLVENLSEKIKKPMNKYRVFFIYKSSDTSDYMDIEAYSESQARSYVKRLPYVYHVADVILIEEAPKEEPFIPTNKCDKCGRYLNDSGECPLCDLNDESVLDESFKNIQATCDRFAKDIGNNWSGITIKLDRNLLISKCRYHKKMFDDQAPVLKCFHREGEFETLDNVSIDTGTYGVLAFEKYDFEDYDYLAELVKEGKADKNMLEEPIHFELFLPYNNGWLMVNDLDDIYDLDMPTLYSWIKEYDKTELFEKLENTSIKDKVKNILDKYNNEKTSNITLFEVEQPEGNFIEQFDDGDIDFSKFTEHNQKNEFNYPTEGKYYSFMISGGLNGSGEWDDYLEDIKKIFIEFEDKLHLDPVLYQLDTDIADDVWTGYVFLYADPTENELKESLLYEDLDDEDIKILKSTVTKNIDKIISALDNDAGNRLHRKRNGWVYWYCKVDNSFSGFETPYFDIRGAYKKEPKFVFDIQWHTKGFDKQYWLGYDIFTNECRLLVGLQELKDNTWLNQEPEYEIMEDIKDTDNLFSMTPYMLRNDGAFLECGDLHPYIKMSNNASYETNLKTLNSHPDFLDWFYKNTLNEETKELIEEFKKEPDEDLMNLLNDLTNQEFCRVRTSNYKVKYGGDNGQIYFRISSTGFNWFDLIWNVVSKFAKDIKEVTVMKDKQTFGGKEFDYYYDHLPTEEFLTLKGNPIVEGK